MINTIEQNAEYFETIFSALKNTAEAPIDTTTPPSPEESTRMTNQIKNGVESNPESARTASQKAAAKTLVTLQGGLMANMDKYNIERESGPGSEAAIQQYHATVQYLNRAIDSNNNILKNSDSSLSQESKAAIEKQIRKYQAKLDAYTASEDSVVINSGNPDLKIALEAERKQSVKSSETAAQQMTTGNEAEQTPGTTPLTKEQISAALNQKPELSSQVSASKLSR